MLSDAPFGSKECRCYIRYQEVLVNPAVFSFHIIQHSYDHAVEPALETSLQARIRTMDRPDPNTYAGDSVPVSWLGGETTNRLSGDAVDGSVSVASALDSEAHLIDVEDFDNP